MKQIIFTFILFTTVTLTMGQSLKASEDTACLTVKVMDMKENIRSKDIIIFKGQQTKKSFQGISNAQGSFDILLPEGDIYDIQVAGLGENQEYSTIEIPSGPGLVRAGLTIQYEPATSVTLKNVLFNTGKSSLRSDAFASLNELAEYLLVKDDVNIEISGHTDNVGDPLANKELSQSRASTVRQFLIKKGVDSKRIMAKGYGEAQPVASNTSEEGRQQNRRIEVRIL